MSKKSKIIISVVGALLFVAIILTGTVVWYKLDNRGSYSGWTYVKYDGLPNVLQENFVYLSNEFFEKNDLRFATEQDEIYMSENLSDEVRLAGSVQSTRMFFLDFTRRNEDMHYYKFYLIRKDGSDKPALKLELMCENKNLTVLFHAKKYGGCKYEKFDATSWYCINTDKASRKCQFSLHISVEKSYDYTAEEKQKIEMELVSSLIDNILSYDEIMARREA